ncbi:unnamed protein product [Ilex paraguariensis]|uniref:RNase H type-1 domain-containing protein n=1 Tax=Ilex paraguariensis TaxID=185542 RepID=A0ABC8STN5_9AQUA
MFSQGWSRKRACEQDGTRLKLILQRYCEAAGQLINLNKSRILFSSNTPEDRRRTMSQLMEIEALPTSKDWDFDSLWKLTNIEEYCAITAIPVSKNLNTLHQAVEVLSKVAIIWWSIWRMRNDDVFHSAPPNPTVALKRARVDGWFRPSIGLVMANCDGVFNIKLKKLAIGVVIRDHKERNEAIVVSDSHVLISLCTGEKAPPWEIAALVDDIKLISHSLRLRLVYYPRNSNKAAYWVAKAKLSSSVSNDWVFNPPAELGHILSYDCMYDQFS